MYILAEFCFFQHPVSLIALMSLVSTNWAVAAPIRAPWVVKLVFGSPKNVAADLIAPLYAW